MQSKEHQPGFLEKIRIGEPPVLVTSATLKNWQFL